MNTLAQFNSRIKKASTVEELRQISYEAYKQSERIYGNVSILDKIIDACIKKEKYIK